MAKSMSISLERTGGILKDGIYSLRVESSEVKQGAKGDYLNIRYRLAGKGSTSMIFDIVSFSEGARFRLEAFLDAMNFPAKGNLTVAKLMSAINGKAVWVKLGNESYNGKMKNVISQYLTQEMAEQLLEIQSQNKGTATEEPSDEDTEEEGDWEEDDDDDDWGDDNDDDDATSEDTEKKDGFPL